MICIEGALAGLKTVAGILPTAEVGLMAAVGVLRTSGFLDFLSGCWDQRHFCIYRLLGGSTLLLVRLVSVRRRQGLLLDIFKTLMWLIRGSAMVSVLERLHGAGFYTMSVCYLTVRISKTRWTLRGR